MRELLSLIPAPKATGDSWQGVPVPPPYVPVSCVEGEAWFVDGGNAAILEAPHFSLQRIRAVGVQLPTKQIIKLEEDCLLLRTSYGWDLHSSHGLIAGAALGELQDAITQARQQLEHAVAKQCTGFVVLDGDVAPAGCVAVQKTCTVLTKCNFPLSSVLTKPGPWYAKLGDVYAVKLHARARHVLLVHGAAPEQLSVLASHCTDCVFPGYPYGLVLADRLARVSHEEAATLRVHARALLHGLEHIAEGEAAIDSHRVLDRIG